MQRFVHFPYKKYLLLGALLFLLVSLPAYFVEHLRVRVIGLFMPAWKWGVHLGEDRTEEKDRLEIENHFLRTELEKLRALVQQERMIKSLEIEISLKKFPPKKSEEMKSLLELHKSAVAAQVIYRDPETWSSSLWINVGEEDNRRLEETIIKKNSPVLSGFSVVGAIDFVGEKRSRVRLITDVALKPSVRVARGFSQNALLLENVDYLLYHIKMRKEITLSEKEKSDLIQLLEPLQEHLSADVKEWYLAKGVLQGSGTPLWRSLNHTLRGIGFNYDVADTEGPSRPLITEKLFDPQNPSLSMIQVADLLVTTGMDGVFPPGLRIAEVRTVFPCREGAFTYEIEALPVVKNLDTLQTVFVIAPWSSDEELPTLGMK